MKCVICDLKRFDALLVQVPCGQHRTLKLLQNLRRSFPRTSGLKPVVLLGLIAVIPTNDDLLRETLDVVIAFVIWGVLHGIVHLELL